MKFLLTGDSLFSSSNLAQRIDKRILKVLEESDEVFTNAEFVTPREHTSPAAGRGYQTSVRPAALDEFQRLHIKYVSFANNHTGDYGIEGMKDTIEEAKKRGLVPLGVGLNLHEAAKPVFIDTEDGRIALINVGITRSEVFAAADPGSGVPGRPGVNPLRWSRKYVVDENDYENLTAIAKRIGVYQSMELGKKIETFPETSKKEFDFGSLFEGRLTFAEGTTPGVKTAADKKDLERIKKTIRDARERSDYVFVGMHTHEGENENWYSDEPAEFVREFAHEAVDAGADCVFGHGAHFARGVELYHKKPVFYNLGSLFMEFEAGESIISPEMFESYGYDEKESPSTLHKNRTKDKDGNWQGFYSDRKFTENFLVQFSLNRNENKFDFELLPIDLNLTDSFVTKRGIPTIASEGTKAHLLARLNEIGIAKYHTKIRDEDGHFKVREA